MRRMLVLALAVGVLLGGVLPVGASDTDAWRTIGEGSIRGRNAEVGLSTQIGSPAAFRVQVDHSQGRDVQVSWELTCVRRDPPGKATRSGSVTLTPPTSRPFELPVAVDGCEISLSARPADGEGGILQVRLQVS